MWWIVVDTYYLTVYKIRGEMISQLIVNIEILNYSTDLSLKSYFMVRFMSIMLLAFQK